jgi:hypothetical protein
MPHTSPKRHTRIPAARGLIARAAALYAAPIPVFVSLAMVPDLSLRLTLAFLVAVAYIALGVYLDYVGRLYASDLFRSIAVNARSYREGQPEGEALHEVSQLPVQQL